MSDLSAQQPLQAFKSLEWEHGAQVGKEVVEIYDGDTIVARLAAALILPEEGTPSIQFSFGAARDLGISPQEVAFDGPVALAFLDLAARLRTAFRAHVAQSLPTDLVLVLGDGGDDE